MIIGKNSNSSKALKIIFAVLIIVLFISATIGVISNNNRKALKTECWTYPGGTLKNGGP